MTPRSSAPAHARALGRCLNLCVNLERLDINQVGLDEEGGKALFSALAAQALPELTWLDLDSNTM